jgi:omega-6 fatty acid desaturase (delta-12 desaturase)
VEPLVGEAPPRAPWQEITALYARPHLGRTLLALLTSVAPFLALWTLMYLSLQVSYLLVLALAIPTSGFLVRTYILFHDCAHGSLLPGRRANAYLGAVLALLVATPFAKWRHEHTVHHATAGDLDRRGVGDVPTLTVAEYRARSWRARLGYRMFRNPAIMFGIGPIYAMLVLPRVVRKKDHPRIKRSVWGTNVALAVLVGGLCWALGWKGFLLVEAPLIPLAGGMGLWLFYVQHQFDTTYWRRSPEWTFADAGLYGSSYLRLPASLRFFTGNIGFHHVHHLNPRIPSYNLPRAHDASAAFQTVPQYTLWDGLRFVRFKLWDEEAERLVTWSDLRRRPPMVRARALAGG